MYCTNCGAEIAKEAYVCPKCGVLVKENRTNSEDKPNTGLNILALFVPIVGLVLYFTWKKDTPVRAKSILIFALIGWGIRIAFSIFNIVSTIIVNS